MRKNKGVTYTTGLLLTLLIGLIVISAVGYHLLINRTNIGHHVISAKNLFVVKRGDGYYIKLLVTNDGSDSVRIDKIVVTDGENTIVFGDGGTDDGLPESMLDTLANQKVIINPGQTFILQEFQQTPESFQLKSGITATIYYTILSTGESYTITVGGKAVLSVEVGEGEENEQPPPPPPGGSSGEFKVIFSLKTTSSNTWEKFTSPAGHYVKLYKSTYKGRKAYTLSTSGSSDSGYRFYAYYTKRFDPYTTVTVSGYVAVYDTFPDSLARSRRVAYIYVISANNPSNIIKYYQIAGYRDTDWKYFQITINGPSVPFYIAIGRPDWWSRDWRLTVYFSDISITSSGSGGMGYFVSTLVFKVNETIAPNLFQYDDLNGHLTILDPDGRKLQYTILYYNKQLKVAWISVKPQNLVYLSPNNQYVITVKYGPNGESASSQTWFWSTANYYVMDEKTERRYTSIYYEKVVTVGNNPPRLEVRTYPYYRKHNFNIHTYYLDYPVLKGFQVLIYERSLSTTYRVDFKTVDGKLYKLLLSSCWYGGPEFRLYVKNGNSWTLIASKELGCRNRGTYTIIDIISDSSVPRRVGTTYRYVIGKPIEWISVMPTGGDNGNSFIYLYVYTGHVGTIRDYNFPMFFGYVKVSYQT